MTETTWSEEMAEPPKKKGIPIWVWGCGGGCLLAVIALLVGGVFVAGKIQDGLDPEKVWPKIAEVLPFDERPDYKVGGGTLGIEGYGMLAKEEGLFGLLLIMENEKPEETDQLFSGEVKGGFAGVGELKDSEVLTVDVKDRPCRALRFVSEPPAFPGMKREGSSSVMLIDLSRDPSRLVMLELFVFGAEADQEAVNTFLAPFDPWR